MISFAQTNLLNKTASLELAPPIHSSGYSPKHKIHNSVSYRAQIATK